MFRFGFARCPLDGTPLQKLSDDPLAGSLFADRYVIEQCIGEGGMGRVYRARHRRVSRRFAIKVLYGDHAADPKMRERFAREAEAASRLDHPNVISVVDFGETDDRLLYLVMDFVEGRELADIIEDDGPLDAARAERFLRQLCAGLEHAHGKGLVHRDFKPENVIITGDGDSETARIVDFGIAVMSEPGDDQRLTTEGLVLGTPAYMSPEQATGAELDHRTDLFSLGVLVYEMLAGVMPFEGPPLAIARQNLSVDPPPIAERVPGLAVPRRLELIAMRLMAKAPADRFDSARAVIDELDRRSSVAATAATSAIPQLTPAGDGGESLDTSDMAAIAPAAGGSLKWLGVAAVAVAAVVVAVVAMRGGGSSSRATATVDAGPVARPNAPDVSHPDAAPPRRTDAAVAAARTDARPAKRATLPKRTARHVSPRRTTHRHVRRHADAGVRKAKRPAVDAASANPRRTVTAASVSNRYIKVGQLLKQLQTAKGKATAKPYEDAYLRLPPLADVLRSPSSMAQVDRKLRGLQGRISRALHH